MIVASVASSMADDSRGDAPSISSAASAKDDPDRALVTELRHQLEKERRLREEAERSLALRSSALDAASTHFMILDLGQPGWPMVYVNGALARDHGYEADELIGRSASCLVPPELNGPQLAALNAAIVARQSARGEVRSRRRDGSTFSVGLSLHPIPDHRGAVTHYVSIAADITQRLIEAEEKRKLQDQLLSEMQERERIAIELRLAQKLEAIGRLAAGIAHEINTPIQYVGDGVEFLRSGFTGLQELLVEHQVACRALADGTPAAGILQRLEQASERIEWTFLSEEIPRAVERSLDGIARVSDIVRAMKEFAHPDASEQSGADLNHALSTTLLVARNEYKYVAGVHTQFGEIPQVLCNAGELNQVFLNLIVNAAHAIEAAGRDPTTGRIGVATARIGECVEITISDNGCGIPSENLDRIFDPFFTTKEVGKGTGQGLAIARTIVVEKHAGSIEVKSEPGVGTQFVLKVPIAGRMSEQRQ